MYCTGHKEPIRHYFDEEEKALRERIKAHFPDKRFGVADTDKEENFYLIYVGGDRTRGATGSTMLKTIRWNILLIWLRGFTKRTCAACTR